MKTYDLARKKITLEKLLQLAEEGAVRILSPEGHAFVLENAEGFDKETALLGKSKKFRRFLKERSKEPSSRSLEEYRRKLD